MTTDAEKNSIKKFMRTFRGITVATDHDHVRTFSIIFRIDFI